MEGPRTLRAGDTGLTRRFGETLAVGGIDVAVGKGVVYGLLGRNGAARLPAFPVRASSHSPDRVGLQDGELIVRDNLAQHAGSTVHDYMRGRGPHRIDPYLADASSQGIVRIVTVAPGRKKLEVTDAAPINAMTRRLVAVLDDPAPGFKDISFAVLADAAGIARPHLRGWAHRRHRACLSALRDATGDGAPAEILLAGLAAISQLSQHASELANTDPRTFDERIGLTPEARRAAMWFDL